MVPSHQGLAAADRAVLERHLQLIVQFELVPFSGALEIARQRPPGAGGIIHVALIHRDRAALPALAPVHGKFGVAQQLIAFPRIGRENRKAD